MTTGAQQRSLELIRVDPADWHAQVERTRADGAEFLALYADGAPTPTGTVTIAFADPDGIRALHTQPRHRELPSIVDLVPAAQWDEREAHDLFGIRFAGHAPLRPLVVHGSTDWLTDVSGDDVHQIAVGPIHAGVIESGHFRFHAVGERILHLDVQLFYKHRGLERAAVGAAPDAALALGGRACAACTVANTVAVANALEAATGCSPDEQTRRARTLLIELERLYNHLNDIGAICSGIGFAPGNMIFAALKERAQRINARVAGHRFLFGSVRLGGSALELGRAEVATLLEDVRLLGAEAAAAWQEILFNPAVRDRTVGTGALPTAAAIRLGACGPAARASGVVADARVDDDRLWYAQFQPALPPDPTGDVAARLEMRAIEIQSTVHLLEDVLGAPIAPGGTKATRPPCEVGAGIVESPRGRTFAGIALAHGGVRRMHLRTASFANWPSVAVAATHAIVPDFPLVNKSFELCYACVDR
jgi:Ni,Fe-hydrogenase III large subunit